MGESLGQLTSLKKINLDFRRLEVIEEKKLIVYRCVEVTDEGPKNLTQGFKTLISLQDLSLQFDK